MSLQIILPSSVKPKYRCRVPTGDGEVCGYPCWTEKDIANHSVECAKRHEQEIAVNSPRYKLPVFYDPNHWDPEYEAHMLRVGKRMIEEGRDEILPHER